MRLGELLSKAPRKHEAQVERFLGRNGDDVEHEPEIVPGYHEMVEAGTVCVNFYCLYCNDVRTFASGSLLSCLVVGERVVSIDAFLMCAGCGVRVEAWFLVTSRDDLTSQAPTIRLARYVDGGHNKIARLGAQTGAADLDDLLGRAHWAYEQRLGLGSMVYLRIIFEALTKQTAEVAGVPLTGKKGGRKPFRDLLMEVDRTYQIIPPAFSGDGYRLYGELSEIVHGNASEATALEKFGPCETLVRGVIQNIASNQKMKQAIEDLGWSGGDRG